MLDQLQNCFPTLTISRQSEWLKNWGIAQLVDEGHQYWENHKLTPGLTALKMRSRRTELGSICDDEGLGSFLVMEMRK
jgi:hypothetical protein